MSAPRFSAVTLAALARLDEARRASMLWRVSHGNAQLLKLAKEYDLARFALETALDADRERHMRDAEDAALAAHAGPQPHRFGGVL